MSITFKPSGHLDVSTDPSDLPETVDQYGNIQSSALTRCKNLRIDQKGMAKTRDGNGVVYNGMSNPVTALEFQDNKIYSFSGSKIYEDSSEIESGLTGGNWVTIRYNSFNDTAQNIFALNGFDRVRIEDGVVYEWGIESPSVAPVNSAGTSTGLTGTYNTKYTYVRKVGSVVVSESNPSPEGNATALTDDKLNVSVTATADPQVTHIRLYRTFAGGEEYFFDQDIAVGSTSFVSTQADADLGDLLAEDHDRPPLGTYVLGPAYDGTCFIIKDNLLYYSKPKQPEYWPALNFIEVSAAQTPGQTLVFHNGQIYYLTLFDIYYIQGTGANFLPLPMKAKAGAMNYRGAVSVAGKGIYHTGPEGIYLFSSGVDKKITEENFETLFNPSTETVNGMPVVTSISESILFTFRNRLYFIHPQDPPDDGAGSNLLILNLDTNKSVYYQYTRGNGTLVDICSIASLENTGFNRDVIWLGTDEGEVRIAESGLDDDSGEPIEWEIQSKDFILATRKHFPRWVKYDVDASDADSCEGELILNGSTLHTHTITGNRDIRRRLVEADNGSRCSIRISGTGPVSIYGAESE